MRTALKDFAQEQLDNVLESLNNDGAANAIRKSVQVLIGDGADVEEDRVPAAPPRAAYRDEDGGLVNVKAADLYHLVNEARMMIRLAREGKTPSQDKRAPLCRAIKAVKAQQGGKIRKPHGIRD